MIRGRNIIAIASNWHFDPTSKHHVMRILAEENHVVWVNYHGSRRPQLNKGDLSAIWNKLGQIRQGPEQITPTLTVLTPLLLPLPGSRWARSLNQQLVVRQIRRVLRRLPDQPVQLWSFAPDVDYLVGRFNEELDLYYCVDEFSAFSTYDAATIQQLERALIDRCDLVITTARNLQNSKSAYHPHTYLVNHGVSYDHFARAMEPQTDIPEAIRGVPAPIFGYFGMVQDWLDQELIEAVARRHPDWSFVFLGKQEVAVDRLRTLPNVHLLGQVKFADLPGYCKAFDVGLIPFKINNLTINVNPIKLREYLAAGLPVVSTDLPEVRAYRPHVLIGENAENFESACRQALQQRSLYHRQQRQAAVRHETWPDKVREIAHYVQDIQGEIPAHLADRHALLPCN
ncbi:MAG: hypothetical protein HJJLKODD_01056 [Phycisphaerae bacterium]|nr:hypothetical protein [Phycisphaerae bacterium]